MAGGGPLAAPHRLRRVASHQLGQRLGRQLDLTRELLRVGAPLDWVLDRADQGLDLARGVGLLPRVVGDLEQRAVDQVIEELLGVVHDGAQRFGARGAQQVVGIRARRQERGARAQTF